MITATSLVEMSDEMARYARKINGSVFEDAVQNAVLQILRLIRLRTVERDEVFKIVRGAVLSILRSERRKRAFSNTSESLELRVAACAQETIDMDNLSAREKEVVTMLVAGNTPDEIRAHFDLTEPQYYNVCARIKRKMSK